MDLLEAGFRAKYEKVCVGNLAVEDEDVFFEGLLCEEGLGEFSFGFGFGSFGFFPLFHFFSSFFFLFFSFQSIGRGSADQTRGLVFRYE